MAAHMTTRAGLAVISGVLLLANCGSPDGDPSGAGGSQDGGSRGGRAGAGGTGGGSAGSGGARDSGAGTGGKSGAGGSVGKGGSSGGGGAAGSSGAGGVGGSAGSGTGGSGPVDGGGGVGGTIDGGGAGGAGNAGTAGRGGGAGSGGSIDAGRDGVGGSAGIAGAGGAKDGGAGKAGAGGQAGSSGAGGGTVDSGPPGTCPTALVGWATVSGDGVTSTTGGGNAAPVRPTTAAQLLAYASDGTARVIEISGTFAVPDLDVASNKTIVGIGNNATINGGIRIRGDSSTPVSNVIIRNLRINGATTAVDSDAVQVYFAHHVWIDHCEIWDGLDGNLDMSHAVNWVTVSWTKFRYTAAIPDHRFSSLIGHSDDNASEDNGRLKVTFHHNWWAEQVIERMPRVRFGQVHVFNNYYSSTGNNYCVRAGASAHLLVEGNYFDGVNSPHEFNSSADEMTASITARNNTYNGGGGNRVTGGGGTPFTSVPYSATIESAAGIPASVKACAGPR
jgi:pectate lyase